MTFFHSRIVVIRLLRVTILYPLLSVIFVESLFHREHYDNCVEITGKLLQNTLDQRRYWTARKKKKKRGGKNVEQKTSHKRNTLTASYYIIIIHSITEISEINKNHRLAAVVQYSNIYLTASVRINRGRRNARLFVYIYIIL